MDRGLEDTVSVPLFGDDSSMDAWERKGVEAGKSRWNKHLQVGQRAYAGVSPSSPLRHRQREVVSGLAHGPLSYGTGFNLFTPGRSDNGSALRHRFPFFQGVFTGERQSTMRTRPVWGGWSPNDFNG